MRSENKSLFMTLWRENCAQTSVLRTNDDPGCIFRLYRGAEGNEAEELALQIRGEYLAMSSCAGQAAITADYGQRVYQYELAVAVDGEETTLTLSAPDTVAGITARVTGQDGQLEYDGLSVETGPLDPEGLSPVSAVPALLEGARSGYIVSCALEEDGALLRMDCGEPGGNSGHRKRGIPVVRRLYPCPVQRRDIGGRIPGHFM